MQFLTFTSYERHPFFHHYSPGQILGFVIWNWKKIFSVNNDNPYWETGIYDTSKARLNVFQRIQYRIYLSSLKVVLLRYTLYFIVNPIWLCFYPIDSHRIRNTLEKEEFVKDIVAKCVRLISVAYAHIIEIDMNLKSIVIDLRKTWNIECIW